jgi:hypothetical protein
MKKVFVSICYNLGLWGIFGFFATIILGFLACCANLSQSVFFGSLIVFATVGLISSVIGVLRVYNKAK